MCVQLGPSFILPFWYACLSRVSAFDFDRGTPDSVPGHSQHFVNSPTRNRTVNRNSSSPVSFECSTTDFDEHSPINSIITWGRRLSSNSNNSQPVQPLKLTANLLFNVSTRIEHSEIASEITSSLWIVPSQLCTEDFHFEYVCAILLPGTSGAVPWSTDGFHLTGVGGGGRSSCTSLTLPQTAHAANTDSATSSTASRHPCDCLTEVTLNSSAGGSITGQSETEQSQGSDGNQLLFVIIVVAPIVFLLSLLFLFCVTYRARRNQAADAEHSVTLEKEDNGQDIINGTSDAWDASPDQLSQEGSMAKQTGMKRKHGHLAFDSAAWFQQSPIPDHGHPLFLFTPIVGQMGGTVTHSRTHCTEELSDRPPSNQPTLAGSRSHSAVNPTDSVYENGLATSSSWHGNSAANCGRMQQQTKQNAHLLPAQNQPATSPTDVHVQRLSAQLSTDRIAVPSLQLSPLSKISDVDCLPISSVRTQKDPPKRSTQAQESPVAHAYLQALEDQQIFRAIQHGRSPPTSPAPCQSQLPGGASEGNSQGVLTAAAEDNTKAGVEAAEEYGNPLLEDLKRAVQAKDQMKQTNHPTVKLLAVTDLLPAHHAVQYHSPSAGRLSAIPHRGQLRPLSDTSGDLEVPLATEQENQQICSGQKKSITRKDRPSSRTPLGEIQYEQVVIGGEEDANKSSRPVLRTSPRAGVYEQWQLRAPPRPHVYQEKARYAPSVYAEVRRTPDNNLDDSLQDLGLAEYGQIETDGAFVIYEEPMADNP